MVIKLLTLIALFILFTQHVKCIAKTINYPVEISFLSKGGTGTNLNIVGKNKEKIFIVKLFNKLGFWTRLQHYLIL